jgi:hypothetical protein
MEKNIMVYLAGGIAQRRHNVHSYRRYHAKTDHEVARDFARRIAGHDEGAALLLRYLDWHTDLLVTCYWDEIECVAAALLERRTLKRGKVREIINAYHARIAATRTYEDEF